MLIHGTKHLFAAWTRCTQWKVRLEMGRRWTRPRRRGMTNRRELRRKFLRISKMARLFRKKLPPLRPPSSVFDPRRSRRNLSVIRNRKRRAKACPRRKRCNKNLQNHVARRAKRKVAENGNQRMDNCHRMEILPRRNCVWNRGSNTFLLLSAVRKLPRRNLLRGLINFELKSK